MPAMVIAPGEPRAWASPRAWIILLLVTSLALAADLFSKSMAFANIAHAPVTLDREAVLRVSEVDPSRISALIPPHEAVSVVPGLLELTLVLNPGAVFGIGAGKRWFFMVFTGIAMAFAFYMFAVWTRSRDWLSHTAIGLLIAGGLGNLYDRWFFGCVRDFLHPLPKVKWPFGLKLTGNSGEIWPYVSNVADLFLIIGILVLAVRLWKQDAKHARAAAPSATP